MLKLNNAPEEGKKFGSVNRHDGVLKTNKLDHWFTVSALLHTDFLATPLTIDIIPSYLIILSVISKDFLYDKLSVISNYSYIAIMKLIVTTRAPT